MALIWDKTKRQWILRHRGLDFADAVFAGRFMTLPDERKEYGERRFITAGWLRHRFVILAWTPRGPDLRIISMSDGHADEEEYYDSQID